MSYPRSSETVWLSTFGKPAEVAEVRHVPVGKPRAGEALVAVENAPINPADLNVLEGKYGILPQLPAVPGVEGVGTVLEVGEGVASELVGRRVLLPAGFGSWRQFGMAQVSDLVAVPEGVPVQQAAMLRINPATALCMLEEFVRLQPGEWIVQNAANSGVGRSVIQIARACGWRTVNVVRRGGVEAELRGLGGDVVLEDGEGLVQRIAEATGKAPIRLGLNAVGGESALSLSKALAECGTLVTYGAMGLQPLRVPNGMLIFKDLSFRGFWVSRWYKAASSADVARLFERLFGWAVMGVLHTPVEAEYALGEVVQAILHASRGGRAGKVLLKP